MTAVLTAFLMSNGWQMAPAILTGLLAAAVVGTFNGLCITRLNMSPLCRPWHRFPSREPSL
jgi:ribose/xylose/arabinose/galactoside ABC-type transport system permease subunit